MQACLKNIWDKDPVISRGRRSGLSPNFFLLLAGWLFIFLYLIPLSCLLVAKDFLHILQSERAVKTMKISRFYSY